MKKLIYSALAFMAVGFASCDDESYDDWAQPITNAQEASQSFTFSAAAVDAINLADIDTNIVKVFTPTVDLTDDNATVNNFNVLFSDGSTISADANGNVLVDDLVSVIEAIYGKAPELRTLPTSVVALINRDGQLMKSDTAKIEIKATLEAPVIESAYYVIGAVPGWSFEAAATAKFEHSDENVYDDPIFTITMEAPYKKDDAGEFVLDEDGNKIRDDYWFRFVPQSSLDKADWSGTIGCLVNGTEDLEGKLYMVDEIEGDGCIKMPATDGALFYKIELNMMDYTYKVTPLMFENYIYMPGNAQGWSPETAPALKHQGNGIYTGFAYMDGEFKFTRARNWSSEYNAGAFKNASEGFSLEKGDGGNIINSVAGLYYFEVDVVNGDLKATKITNMNLVGAFNGWKADDDAQQMTWNATDLCYEITGATVTADGWKFTANNDWAINLGGSLTDLVGGGDNLSAVGTTIKLYPCRTTKDEIYATVE